MHNERIAPAFVAICMKVDEKSAFAGSQLEPCRLNCKGCAALRLLLWKRAPVALASTAHATRDGQKAEATSHRPQGQGPERLNRAEFERRLRERFFDPAFADAGVDIESLSPPHGMAMPTAAKPRHAQSRRGISDPDYPLSIEWLATRDAIAAAQTAQTDVNRPARVLLICASPRNDKTCPGEISKSFRLVMAARDIVVQAGNECDVLDLSLLTSEYGRVIHPCKACVSTAMPLCHWPCSCYPNHSLGQVNDWMNEIYPRWVAAHGILIVTPVHWYQVPSTLKLMLDRLVCADGGNPDPTTTQGKNPALAKRIELDGWDYPRHLAGRAFAVVAHGDVEGAEGVRRSLVDWLTSMKLVQAGAAAAIDRYIGYYEPYASSHEALDCDTAIFEEVRNAAHALINAIALQRQGRTEPDASLNTPRDK